MWLPPQDQQLILDLPFPDLPPLPLLPFSWVDPRGFPFPLLSLKKRAVGCELAFPALVAGFVGLPCLLWETE